ncbi:uncharacterized protein ACMZJ9_014607 [Mantella aurantiaca]
MEATFTPQQTYIDEFSPVEYLQMYYDPAHETLSEWTNFVLKNLHDVFSSGDVGGDTIIDIGTGPTIHQLLSACEAFNNIIVSDFLEQNLAELQKWLKKAPGKFDWTSLIRRVCELEGNRMSCEEKAEKLRSKVKEVLKCDVLKRNPFEPLTLLPVDCVISCLCLEVCCKDMDSFYNVLTNIKDLIKPGGHLLLLSMLNGHFYSVGDKHFSALPITKEGLEKALKDAGYEIVELKFSAQNYESMTDIFTADTHYYVNARKPVDSNLAGFLLTWFTFLTEQSPSYFHSLIHWKGSLISHSVHLNFIRCLVIPGEETNMETPYTSSQTYIDEFDPVDYFKTYYHHKEGTFIAEWIHFVLRNLHETFTSGDVKGDLLIDFGAGPTIYHLLSACEAFNNIITSDFLEQNRAQLQKWLKKDPGALDWTPIVKLVCELEGNSDSESWKKKEEKLRRTVTKVLKCDALKKNPYDPVVMPQADCLISCLCLEAPCKDVESFTNVLRNIKGLIKPGGHIILQSVLNCTYYYVGEKKFFCLAITKEELETSFKEAGYEIVKLKVTPRAETQGMGVSDYDSYYFVHARKPCA